MINAKNGIDAMIRIVLSFSFLYSQIDTASINTTINNMRKNTIMGKGHNKKLPNL